MKLKATGKVLDVGCGDGHLLYLAMRRGFDGYGVEPNEILCRYASAKARAQVVQGDYAKEMFPESYFDVITLVHILEHFWNPDAILEAAWHQLRAGGILVIEVPSIHSPHFLAYEWTGIRRFVKGHIARGHAGYFSPRPLLTLTERIGFRKVSLVTGRCRCKYSGAISRFAGTIDPLLNALNIGAILYIGIKKDRPLD
ncbi:MAG: class I SAM-dependent methyltransferase [Chloroflexi bacterium]|nr:class I SAM-dependent methyltransferase [Chloroflexota bacterium]